MRRAAGATAAREIPGATENVAWRLAGWVERGLAQAGRQVPRHIAEAGVVKWQGPRGSVLTGRAVVTSREVKGEEREADGEDKEASGQETEASGQEKVLEGQDGVLPGQENVLPRQENVLAGVKKVLAGHEKVLGRQDGVLPGVENVLPGVEKVLPVEEKVLPGGERVLAGQENVLGQGLSEARSGQPPSGAPASMGRSGPHTSVAFCSHPGGSENVGGPARQVLLPSDAVNPTAATSWPVW